MKRYKINASEIIFYEFNIEAKNKKEAERKAKEHIINYEEDVIDGEDFEITKIKEMIK